MADDCARYARQIIFHGIGEEGQQRLLNARVALVGCGADGTLIADRLVRAGVGHVTIIDRDFVELDNLQRQFLYEEDDARTSLPKAIAAERRLHRINSQVTVEGIVTDLNAENAEELLGGADLVMDGTDNPGARYIINDVCVKHNIPWVYCGVVASRGMTMTIIPHQTPCLRCLVPDPPPHGSTDMAATAGIVNAIVPVMAGIAVCEGLKLLLGTGERLEGMFRLDLWENVIETSESVSPRPGCPSCGHGEYEFLIPESAAQAVALCGSNAVQVRASGAQPLVLGEIARRLQTVGQLIASNDYLIRLKVDDYELILFADARAIIKGTSDETVARSLYSKYIGV